MTFTWFERIITDDVTPFSNSFRVNSMAQLLIGRMLSGKLATSARPCMIKSLSNTFLYYNENDELLGYVIVNETYKNTDSVILISWIETFYKCKGNFKRMLNELEHEFPGCNILPDEISRYDAPISFYAWHKFISEEDGFQMSDYESVLYRVKVKKYVNGIDETLLFNYNAESYESEDILNHWKSIKTQFFGNEVNKIQG